MIVFDASTAILLAKAELLDQFVAAVGQQVVMPQEVKDECCGRDAMDAKLIARAINEKRIEVKANRRRLMFEKVRDDFGLGAGEAAAITLAAAVEGALVATDDRRAINACKLLKIPFTTAASILVRMRQKGLVSREDALVRLEALARYGRYRRQTIAAARAELEG